MREAPHDNYCLISHPNEPRLLLLAGDSGWALPRVRCMDAPDVTAAIAERLGLETLMLRSVPLPALANGEDVPQVFVLEPCTAAWQPPEPGRWVGLAELADRPLAVPQQREVLTTWLMERESGSVPELRLPWALPGWHAQAIAWIADQLRARGQRVTGQIEQVRVLAWSTVLRVPTQQGDVYFKAIAPYGAFEPDLAVLLARIAPGLVPAVIALDQDRRWLLLADAGEPLRERIKQERDVTPLADALRRFAALQQATIPHVERMLATGCPDLRLAALPHRYETLVADPGAFRVGHGEAMSADELATARAAVPVVADLCRRLDTFGIPPALHHDDLNASNMLVRDDTLRFIDWAESAVTHPFLSLMVTLRVARLYAGAEEPELTRLRDAYLSCWTAYAPLDRLVECFALAQRLALLARALVWQMVLPTIEHDTRWEYEDSPSYWVRLFLQFETWVPQPDYSYRRSMPASGTQPATSAT